MIWVWWWVVGWVKGEGCVFCCYWLMLVFWVDGEWVFILFEWICDVEFDIVE